MNKKIILIIVFILMIALVAGLIFMVSSGDENTSINNNNSEIQNNVTSTQAPSKLDDNEKTVSKKKQQELFEFIPKVYTEGIAPFDDVFILDAVMGKIIDIDDNVDFSVANVDKITQKIFGEDISINKNNVSEPDVAKSLFYYSKEAGSYAVIPVGYEGIFEYLIFKNATETDEAYYVYAYTLIGGYSYDEDSITQDEFGDISYENAKVQTIIGDKDGNDLVHVFDNYMQMYNEDVWLEKYSNKMPIFRYTLTKADKGYHLTEVEQINY